MNNNNMDDLRRAMAYDNNGDHQKAGELFRDILAKYPEFHLGHYMYGCFLLKQADWPTAWPHFERRVFTDFYLSQGFFHLSGSFWTGQEVAPNSRLHVISDMGHGDIIMCARFIPLVADRFSHIVVSTPKGLGGLFTDLHPKISVTEGSFHVTDCDLHTFAFSLPHFLGVTPESVNSAAYLRPQPDKVEQWAQRLPSTYGVRVGLAWAGNPSYATDTERSLPPDLLAPVLAVPGIQFHSLQKVPRPGDFETLHNLGAAVIDVTADIKDFADTAAIIANLDLVISVDTAVAHLAGALGKPVWIAVPFASDWRWLIGRDDSIWYASARLFRQSRRYDWPDVMNRMASALQVFAGRA